MLEQTGTLIKKTRVSPSDLRFDQRLYDRMYADMKAHGGELTPTAGWLTLGAGDRPETLADPFSSASFAHQVSSMENMLNAWVGQSQYAIDAAALERYRPFLAPHDRLGLYYSKKYLESVCPEIRVGSYYDGDRFDWSPDHPAEVFVKSTGDFSAQNAMLHDIHHYLQRSQDPALTLGDHIETLAGKRVRTVLGVGKSQLTPIVEKLSQWLGRNRG